MVSSNVPLETGHITKFTGHFGYKMGDIVVHTGTNSVNDCSFSVAFTLYALKLCIDVVPYSLIMVLITKIGLALCHAAKCGTRQVIMFESAKYQREHLKHVNQLGYG